ncbi:MAG: SDR family NAD(P)-dependent oxidoreductase [Bacteroidota bacterium]
MKRIIVTGGNRGIGKEICKQLTRLGHEVILTARSKSKGSAVANELGVEFMQLDVSSSDSIQQFIQRFEKEYGSLDVLINNAGIFLDQNKGGANPDFEVIRQTMETNLLGPWELTVGLISALKKSNDPRIINISSGLGAISEMGAGYPGYRLSKVGMNAMTLMLHSEIGNEIPINTMCPGWVKTDMGGSGASRSL